MKKFFLSVAAAVLCLLSFQSNAYEVDTHFYATYKMARKTGFNHETALILANGSQWVDEGISSTPMGSIVYGTLLRRIWHFPQYRFQRRKVTQDGHAKFATITIAEFDHPVAYKLFDEGMSEGNWFKVGLSIHVVQDSAGHSGFTAEAGHAEFGHHPDRTWLYVAKYKRMTGLIFKMLLALREFAPEEALDPAGIAARQKRLEHNDYKILEDEHWAEIQEDMARNIFKDPRYTPQVVNYMIRIARAKGFFHPSFDPEPWLPKPEDYVLSPEEQVLAYEKYKVNFEDGTPAYCDPYNHTRRSAQDVLRRWVEKMRSLEVAQGRMGLSSIFNLKMLDYSGIAGIREKLELLDMNRTMTLQQKIAAHDRLITKEDTKKMIKQVVTFITSGEIPREFNDENHVEFENDDGPRSLEMALKINDHREWILKKHGKNFEFKADTYFARRAENAQIAKENSIQEMDLSQDLTLKAKTPAILTNSDVEIVSLNKQQQWGIAYVKNNYNARSTVADWGDILTGGKYNIHRHRRVKEFQSVVLLEDIKRNGRYVYFGPVETMNFFGVSKCDTSFRPSFKLAVAPGK